MAVKMEMHIYIFYCNICVLLYIVGVSCAQIYNTNHNVNYLEPGVEFRHIHLLRPEMEVYCYRGVRKNLIHYFQTALLHIDIHPDLYEVYDGVTPEKVEEEYEQHRSSWSIGSFVSWKRKDLKLHPFNLSCFGISASNDFNVRLNIIRVDYWKSVFLGIGMFLFFSAPKLCGNPLFYYLCGVSLGIGASFLILIYFISKLLPKRPFMYGVMVGGWTVGAYVMQLVWDNFRLIAMQYQTHVVSYVIVTGVISFAVCYRYGPVTDKRSKDLIKWTLQSVGMILVFYSSSYQEASVAVILLMLAVYNFSESMSSKIKSYWRKHFPPRIKPMSEDEYYQQGVKETKRALDELRGYCSSPDCDTWKTVLKIKDPIRFAKFMKGNSHLSDDEVLEYESEAQRNLYTELTEDESESD